MRTQLDARHVFGEAPLPEAPRLGYVPIIVMTFHRRADYSQQVLAALARCTGIEKYTILAFCEPGSAEMQTLFSRLQMPCQFELKYNSQVLGCRDNTRQALTCGFARSNYVIHIEDDTLPAPDALLFFEHAADKYRQDATVMAINGYTRSAQLHVAGCIDGAIRRRWFHPWGWATWADRWEEIDQHWCCYKGWGNSINFLRRTRDIVAPLLSRFQNIGATRGANLPNPEHHRLTQHLDYWAGVVQPPPLITEWRELPSPPGGWPKEFC